MIRRKYLALALAPVALAFVACSGDTNVVTGEAEGTGITVQGVGRIEAPPDTGFIDIGVAVEAATVADAREGAATAAAAVIASVRDNGVEERDIRTLNLSIEPRYDYSNNSAPRITGYAVSNTVSIKVRDIDTFSVIIDEATAAGGDAVRVNSIRFDIEDNAELLDRAREAAMEDAKRKAEQLASLGGVSLLVPVSIAEVSEPAPQAEFAALGARDMAYSSTPIQPGTGTVEVRLAVRWSIEGGS